jgi:hypothetical protein
MLYCLDRQELTAFLEAKVLGKDVSNHSLTARIEDAENWQDELSVHTYLLCCVLERRLAHGQDCQVILDLIYLIPNEMFLRLQELDRSFVDFMLMHVRQSNNYTLEEELIYLETSLGQYKYEKAIRY